MATKRKPRLKINAYVIVRDAIEIGLGFALNRLQDAMPDTEIPEMARQVAQESMMNEIMNYLSDVVEWDKSS